MVADAVGIYDRHTMRLYHIFEEAFQSLNEFSSSQAGGLPLWPGDCLPGPDLLSEVLVQRGGNATVHGQ